MSRQKREELGVKAGDKIIIKGNVSFARLDKLVEGEALDKENARRQKLGMLITKPFRSIAIENPEVVNGKGTPLAMFYGQNVYTSKGSGKQTMSFESKSLFPPTFGHMIDGKVVEMEDPQKNPAPGQEVYLMIEAYAPKGFSNLGSSFNAVVYGEGDIEYYEPNNSLAGFGEAMNLDVEKAPVSEKEEEIVANTVTGEDVAEVENKFAGFGVQDEDIAGDNSGQPKDNPFA